MGRGKYQKEGALISVIIPVYNVRMYLKKCIESIIHQTYGNLEILIVDDGSDDGSEAICDQYVEQDHRIKVFHKDNGGLASARNYGLQYAGGDYIGFVDSDDYIDAGMYEHLIDVMYEEVDLASCGLREEYVRRYRRRYLASNFTRGYQIMNNCEAMRELLLSRAFNFSVCNKLFKKRVFDNITFPEGRSSEDIPVMYEIFSNINYAVNNGYAEYHYVHHPESITKGNFFEGRMDYYYYTKKILDSVSIEYPQYKGEALALYLKSVYSLICQIINSSNRKKYTETFRILKGILIENEKTVKESSYIEKDTRKDMLFILEKDFDEKSEGVQDRLQNNPDKDKIKKLSEFYNILVQWVSLKEKGITIGDFMKKKGYNTVAIYGMKELGELLYGELRNSGVNVKYIVDQFCDPILIDVPVLKPEEPLLPVDVVIVTAIHCFEEIKGILKSKIDCPVFSLEDVLFVEYE